MPDRDHWSASMLLRWVLTRDIEAVLSMLDDYGGWLLGCGTVAQPIQPESWDDVLRAYTIDEELRKEEQAATAVVKAELFVIPARREIYSALRRGEIDAWARPNGSGDIVKIAPIQWAGLRFRSLKGHDIAVPVGSKGEPLSLPRPPADYLFGSVPATSTPTMWSDPLFPAEQALKLWPLRDDETSATESGGAANDQSFPALPERPAEEAHPVSGIRTKKTKRRKVTKIGAIKAFIVNKYPSGIPAGVSDKIIAREFAADTKTTVSERTVRRAREDGD